MGLSHLDLGIIGVYLIGITRSEEHTSELQSRFDLVCRLLLEKKNPTPPLIPATLDHVATIFFDHAPTSLRQYGDNLESAGRLHPPRQPTCGPHRRMTCGSLHH